MNKTRHETDGRAINAEPWEPLRGMVKRQCPMCRYLFAAPTGSDELRCPDCLKKSPRARAGGAARKTAQERERAAVG